MVNANNILLIGLLIAMTILFALIGSGVLTYAQSSCSQEDLTTRYPNPLDLKIAIMEHRETCEIPQNLQVILNSVEIPQDMKTQEQIQKEGFDALVSILVPLIPILFFVSLLIVRIFTDVKLSDIVKLLFGFTKQTKIEQHLLPHPNNCCEDCGVYHDHWCKVNKEVCTQ